MGAQHGLTLGSKIQHVGEDTVGLNRNATKINVVQPPAGPNQHNVWGRGISGTGTTYPINAPIDERGTVSDASIDVVIPSPLHHYTKMSLSNANPTINLIDLIVGLTSTFTLDLTNGVALSSLTFSPTLVNAPTLNLGNGQRNVLTIVGHRTSTETRYEVINGAGGGGISFPIIPPVSVRGNVSTTQDIDLSATTAHSTTMTLTGDISITFSSFPATANQIEWEIEITQDGTGGHDVTSWPAAVSPIPVINQTAGTTTIVVLRTNDNGTIITTLTSAGGAADASQWATFAAVQDVNFATFDGINIDRLLFDQAAGSSLAGTDAGITSDASGNLNFNSLDEYNLSIDGTPAIKIEDVGSAVLELNMLDHSIIDAKDIRFDVNATFAIANSEAGIGTSGGGIDELIYNVPSSWEQKWNVNGVTKVTLNVSSLSLATGFRLILSPDATNAGLRLGTVAGDPSVLATSDMWYDSTANQFKGRTNVATIVLGGVQNSISQLDSNVTVTDVGSGVVTTTVDGSVRFQVQAARIDLFSVDIFGIETLTFDSTVGTSTITPSTSGVIWNFPDATDDFAIHFNGTVGFIVDEFLTRVSATTPNTTAAIFELFRDDASPANDDILGIVKFRGRNASAGNIVYGEVHVEIEDVLAVSSGGSFHWTLRQNALFQDQMNLKDGVLAVSRHLPVPAASGAALVLNRVDSGSAVGDEAGEISFNITDVSERNYGVINVAWDNTTVGDDSSRMDIKLLTDDNLQNVLTIRGSAITDNLIAIEVTGESYIKAKTGVMGYFVTSDPDITDSGIIGDSGTIQIPQFSNGTPTLAQLNAAFGAFDGAIGQDISDGKLYVRKSSTVWSFYSESGTVT
ncbi:hypothetical protein LCGC14_0372680 [marine sediment metagenome]|uniref:Uncharacterized protein n=1 Tax=marine sediment metagenome TaxID=412755 RepID=A0A0F9TMT1_9ZZZZ